MEIGKYCKNNDKLMISVIIIGFIMFNNGNLIYYSFIVLSILFKNIFMI